MSNFDIHIGFIQSTNKTNNKPYKPFILDLSKFPSLFIDYNYIIDKCEDMDPISKMIMNKCAQFDPEDRIKCVVIDGYSVAYNSIMKPGTYRRAARQTMIKRLNTYVSKIYEEYLRNPEDFVPRTRYIILVCRIGTMEKELISIMSKLGAIGVYLILADNAMDYIEYPDLFTHLYGTLTYVDFYSLEHNPTIKYDPSDDAHWIYQDPEFIYTLDRFRLQHQNYPTIYPRHFCKLFDKELLLTKPRFQHKTKKHLPSPVDISIF